ncbi:MAG: hypothetical protein NXI32_03655 [bacterium]|nr:hypothetical protein [bacterium]
MLAKTARVFTVLTALLVSGNGAAAEETPDFYRDILPIFSQNCIACHNANQTEGGLNLESFASLMQGGDSGDAIVAQQLEQSYLLARVNGQEEPLMPPEDNAVGAKPLSPAELQTLERWIVAGAPQGMQVAKNSIQWQELPGNLQPIYALAASSDGQFVAFGRGNQIWVAPQKPQPTSSILTLADPNLNLSSQAVGKSHLDIVQSLAVSPDNQRIASGGFRTVKIWKRELPSRTLLAGLAADTQSALASPDGQYIATVTAKGGCEIIDLQTGIAIRFLTKELQTIASAEWMDSTHFLVCDASAAWHVIDVADQKILGAISQDPLQTVTLKRLRDRKLIGLSPEGRLISISCEPAEGNGFHLQAQLLNTSDATYTRLAVSSADPAVIAAGSRDGNVTLYQSETWEPLCTIQTDSALQTLALDQQGNRLVTCGPQSTKLWSSKTGELVAELQRDYKSTRRIQASTQAVSRQAARVEALKGRLPELQKLLDKEREVEKQLADAHSKAAEQLAARIMEREQAAAAVSQTESSLQEAQAALAAAQKHMETVAMELESKKKALEDALAKQQEAQLEVDKKQQALTTASEGADRAAARIPELEQMTDAENQRLSTLQNTLAELEQSKLMPASHAGTFSQDGNILVLAGGDQELRTFSAVDGEPLANWTAQAPVSVFVSPVVNRFLSATSDGIDSSEFAALTQQGQLFSWPATQQWRLERTLGTPEESPFSDRVTALAFSPDGNTLAVGSGPPSRSGEITLIDVESGDISHAFGELHSDTVLAIRFSPDGRLLASAGADKMCWLLDSASKEKLRSFEGHTHHILGLAWQDDGQVLATASADATIKLWKVDTAEQLRTITGFPKEITGLQFVGDSHQLVSSGSDGLVRLHNADDGKQIRSFSGADDALFAIAVAGDRKSILAGGQAGKLSFWNLEDGKLIASLPITATPGSSSEGN